MSVDYAKLVRKRDKVLTATTTEPEPRPVDMEMVRASTQKSGIPQYTTGYPDQDIKGHVVHQSSPTISHHGQREPDAMPTSSEPYARPTQVTTHHNDSYPLSDSPAYPISNYSTLTPQRSYPQPQRHTGNEVPVTTWNQVPTDVQYMRDFRSRDDRH